MPPRRYPSCLLAACCLSAALLPLLAGCRQPTPPPQPSPTSRVVYSRSEAARIVRQKLLAKHPTLQIRELQVTGYWTAYPGMKPGRPVYQCTVVGEIIKGRVRQSYTPVFVFDATTGQIQGLQ